MKLRDNARITLERRYLKKNAQGEILESPEEMLKRVAKNIARVDKDEYGKTPQEVRETEIKFYEIMDSLKFMPNSPTLMNAGGELQQLSACFVLPIEDSMESIFETLKHMALVQKTGGGTGFAFDRLRPAGDIVRSTNGVASGPISFLKIYDCGTEAVKQGGTRRGANMGTLRYDHPDILDFIMCKEGDMDITNFNISVTVSHDFMEKIGEEEPEPYYYLVNPRTGEAYFDPQKGELKQLNARELFDLIVERAWKNGDPGLIFIDQMNKFNPTPHLGKFETTNPCFHPDTLISTEKGLERIEDLFMRVKDNYFYVTVDNRVREEKIAVNGREYFKNGVSYQKARVFFTGVRDIFKVSLINGQDLKVTPEHRVFTVNGWKEARDLNRGDMVLIQSGQGMWADIDDIGEELGLLLGWISGDGWLTSDGKTVGLVFNGKDEIKLMHQFIKIIEKYGGGKRKPHKRENGTWQLMFKRKKLVEKLNSFGLKPHKSSKKRVPAGIFTASEKTVCAFLKGLFSSDGTVNYIDENHRDIRLTSSSKDLLKDVQLILLNLGIMSKIYDRTKKIPSVFKYTTIKGEKREYTGGNYYELIINGDDLVLFKEKINPLPVEGKQNKLSKIARYSRKKTRFFVKVESVIPTREKVPVYDISENCTSSLIAQGIVAHNCGEQPLLPYEACCLGSLNLGIFVEDGQINWELLKETVHTAVHFLDNVIDASSYVIPQIEKLHKEGNRKIGLGIMGWHDMLVKLDIPYDSEEALALAEKVMGFINEEARNKSVELAKERGVFGSFEGSIYDTGDEGDRVRNATRTTIAPTGTISIITGASSGIEPYFSVAFIRKNVLDGVDLTEVNPLFLEIAKGEGFYSKELMEDIAAKGGVQGNSQVPEHVQRLFKTALDIDYTWHVKHQAAFQKHTNNAVSKTINLPREASLEDIKKAFILAWELGCKGITVYRDSSRSAQVLTIGPGGEKKEYVKPIKRPQKLIGETTRKETPLGNLFVTLNKAEDKPFEVFAQIGKAGSDVVAFTEAIARLISLALRCGVRVEDIIGQLEGIGGGRPVGFGPNRVLSVPDAIGKALKELSRSSYHERAKKELCPECGSGTLYMVEGCAKCESCGFSEC